MKHLHPIRRTTNKKKLSVIIPTAGMGLRMKSYGPISLLDIFPNEKLIDRQLKLISTYINPREIIVVGGYEAKRVFDYLPRSIIKVENEKYDTTNVVRSIGLGLRAATSEKCLIIYGDLLFNRYALDLSLSGSAIVIDQYNNMGKDEVGCRIMNNKLQYMYYDLPLKWAQIVLLAGKELRLFSEAAWKPENYKLFGFELINQVLNQQGEFEVFQPKRLKITDIDQYKDLRLAYKEIIK